MGENNTFPDPRLAKQEIISISFVNTDGKKIVYVLEREGFYYGSPHKDFPNEANVVFFKTEKELLTESFRLIWEYPVIITLKKRGDLLFITFFHQ